MLYTDLDASQVQDLVHSLENWRMAMTVAVLPEGRPPQQKLEVIVLRNRELQAMNWTLGGFFSDRAFLGPFLLMSASDMWERDEVIKHELAHAVVAENLGGAPQWLNEGMARYLETTELDERTGKVTWGNMKRILPGWERFPVAPSREVLSQKPWPAAKVGVLTYSASLMVHMLARTHGKEFVCLLTGLNHGERYEPASRRCFASLDWGREYSAEVREQGGSDLGQGRIRPFSRRVASGAMSDADVHSILAIAKEGAARPMDPKEPARASLDGEAGEHWRRALALKPAQVLAASKLLADLGDKMPADKQSALTARIVAENPNDWRAWFWRANSSSTPREERAAALARAVALAPHRPEVVTLQAISACAAERWEDCARLAERAIAGAEWSTWCRVTLFDALEHLGRCDDARAFLASDPEIEAEVTEHLASLGADASRAAPCVAPSRASATAPASR